MQAASRERHGRLRESTISDRGPARHPPLHSVYISARPVAVGPTARGQSPKADWVPNSPSALPAIAWSSHHSRLPPVPLFAARLFVPAERSRRTDPSARANWTTPGWLLLNWNRDDHGPWFSPMSVISDPLATQLCSAGGYSCGRNSLSGIPLYRFSLLKKSSPQVSPTNRVLLVPSTMPAKVVRVRLQNTPSYFFHHGAIPWPIPATPR